MCDKYSVRGQVLKECVILEMENFLPFSVFQTPSLPLQVATPSPWTHNSIGRLSIHPTNQKISKILQSKYPNIPVIEEQRGEKFTTPLLSAFAALS